MCPDTITTITSSPDILVIPSASFRVVLYYTSSFLRPSLKLGILVKLALSIIHALSATYYDTYLELFNFVL